MSNLSTVVQPSPEKQESFSITFGQKLRRVLSTESNASYKSERSREILRSISTDLLADVKKDSQHPTNSSTNAMGGCFSSKKDNSGDYIRNPRDVESQKRRRSRSRSRNSRRSSRGQPQKPLSKRDICERDSSESFEDDPENNYYSIEELIEQKLYVTKQDTAPCAFFFSVAQTIILIVMMAQCNIAPLNINPMIGPYPDALDYWGGKNAYKILNEYEYYRLVTPIMLHAGLLHLVGNVSVQMDNGALYEREWGSMIWMIIYITSAIGSSILSCCFMPNNVSVGSSGAVMGLFGAKLAEVFCRACESDKTQQGRVGHLVRNEQCSETLCAVTLVMLFSFVPFVDWAAHLGGLVSGFCAGMICFSLWIRSNGFKLCWFVIGVGLTIALYSFMFTMLFTSVDPMDDLNDVCGYYKQFFEGYECNCQLDND